jgi:hypothetical protein
MVLRFPGIPRLPPSPWFAAGASPRTSLGTSSRPPGEYTELGFSRCFLAERRVTAKSTSAIRASTMPAAPTSWPSRVMPIGRRVVRYRMTAPRMTRAAPAMTATAATTARKMASRFLLAVAV